MPLFITKFWPFPLPPLCFCLLISCFFGSFIYAKTFLNCRILDRGKQKLDFPIFFNLKFYHFFFYPFAISLIYGGGSLDRRSCIAENRSQPLSVFTPETWFFLLSAPDFSLEKIFTSFDLLCCTSNPSIPCIFLFTSFKVLQYEYLHALSFFSLVWFLAKHLVEK